MSYSGAGDSEILIPDWVVAYYDRVEPDVYDSASARGFFLVRATAQRMTDASASWLEPFGLTALSFNVLAFMRATPDGAMSLSAISRSLHTRPATVTSLIDVLERNGWVARAAHPRVRRTTLATLTPQGAALVERASREHHLHITSIMSVIDERERETLLRLLLKINGGVVREKLRARAPGRAS